MEERLNETLSDMLNEIIIGFTVLKKNQAVQTDLSMMFYII